MKNNLLWRSVLFVSLGGFASQAVIWSLVPRLSWLSWAWWGACAIGLPLSAVMFYRTRGPSVLDVIDDIRRNNRIVGLEGDYAILSSGKRVKLR